MTDAERGEMQRNRGRIDQLLDEVGVLLDELRAEIDRDRQDRRGESGVRGG